MKPILSRMIAAPRKFVRWWWHGDGQRTPWLRRIVGLLFQIFILFPILLIVAFRFLPVPFSTNMVLDLLSGSPVHYSWRGTDAIAPALGRAVIASEDQRFCSHNGFDWKSIDDALREQRRHPSRPLRGASTISQQTARSLFLSPERSWLRKGIEAYFTVQLEALWPKERILTVYLNLADWGHGNYGAEAAAQSYFHEPAAALSPYQAARLAAVLPDPDVWRAVKPGPYVSARTATILARMGEVRRDGLDTCVRR